MYKQKDYSSKEIEEMEWSSLEGMVVLFEAIHIATQRTVDVKMISKQGLILLETETLREEISMMRAAASNGVIRLYDYFESDDFLYLCLERHICYVSSDSLPNSAAKTSELSISVKKELQEMLFNSRNQPMPFETYI